VDCKQINARLDELGEIARSRIPAKVSGDVCYAEIFWMTDAEVTEMHELKAMLPSYGQQRVDAQKRIAERIKSRKLVSSK
jgi:hypothetical protein